MRFRYHILVGVAATAVLVQVLELSLFEGLVIFFSSTLIDVDHYPWFAKKTRNWNPCTAINWYRSIDWKTIRKTGRKHKGLEIYSGPFIFHNWVFVALLAVGSYMYSFFLWVLLGVLIHLIADWITLLILHEPLSSKLFVFSKSV